MWNSLLKISVISYIWKRYKRTLISLPLLLVYFWLISLIHQDFLTFVELNDTKQWIGLSFLVKWVFVLLGIVVFIIFHLKDNQSENSNSYTQFEKKPSNKKTDASNAQDSDPFQTIRQKETLSSKAEKIIQKKSK